MRKKSLFLLILLSILPWIRISFGMDIYVLGNGHDAQSGSMIAPVRSIEGAYDLISNLAQVTYNIILKSDGGSIPIAKNNGNGFTWTKSGSETHPINMYSLNDMAHIRRSSDGSYMITFRNVAYINY
ncbi:MAG: hypothetical protein GKR87_12205 [Kiritimatiellae bacterium]|nr:hypothetical protein [Kiritimatiellia bacterium]